MRPLVSLALSSLLVATVSAGAATGTTQVVQQRLSDGRILLTDHPVRGATTERSWQMPNDDPAAARQRAADVRTEAKEVSERIQRMLDQERRADAERERTRLAALAMAHQGEREDDAVYVGGYGYGYGYGFPNRVGNCHGRGHGRVDHHHGKFPSTDRWGSTAKYGTVGNYGASAALNGAASPPQMFRGR